MSGPVFDAASLRERAGRIAHGDGDYAHGDHILNPDIVAMLNGNDLREAAVLIPVVARSEGAGLLLTRRPETMRKHSGQIAFPGGAIDPEDLSPEAAAMREAEEEIGLRPDLIETIGRLPPYLTTTGFRITPVLALVKPDYALTINPEEVDAAFEVPFAFVMDPENHKRESRVWQGKERYYYAITYQEYYIWGVTAGILRVLYERLHLA